MERTTPNDHKNVVPFRSVESVAMVEWSQSTPYANAVCRVLLYTRRGRVVRTYSYRTLCFAFGLLLEFADATRSISEVVVVLYTRGMIRLPLTTLSTKYKGLRRRPGRPPVAASRDAENVESGGRT